MMLYEPVTRRGGVCFEGEYPALFVINFFLLQVKVVDPKSRTCTTLAGTGLVGHTNGPFETAQFSEPGGLCVDAEGKTLFVADSNNHMIRVVDLESQEVSEVSPAVC